MKKSEKLPTLGRALHGFSVDNEPENKYVEWLFGRKLLQFFYGFCCETEYRPFNFRACRCN